MKEESLRADQANVVMEPPGHTTSSTGGAEMPAPPERKSVLNRWHQKLEKDDVVVYEGNVGKELFSKFYFKIAELKARHSTVHKLTGKTNEPTSLENADLRKIGTMKEFDPAWFGKRPKEKRDKPTSAWNRQ